MAKQLNINLGINADIGQAKAKILELQSTLHQISVGSGIDAAINPEKIKQASTAAKELSIHLNNAFNANTGNFDLSKLDRSLSKSKTSVSELSAQLLNAGTTGQQAFVQLAQSIAAADRPMIGLKGRLAEFATTLKNTARWQISSSILHGFVGAIQSAYGYAQDLNRSLNDIRIVTGYSTDQMADFANEANKAAKSLSTTTNEYAKASLIYFQQGLSTEEVKERADVTVKMANVTQQSAQTVSEQMTAVWNNFDDGSKSLEYYADVMTALGAKTASSAAEIAGGLEKFAAIGDTIGLSYEYAAAALATITANTRQSEEVVGTALKTIFARIQGLKLGETLDDGTDLNKYSEALQKVGISIFDSSGELKKMDNILSEMGNKWDDLSKAQQVALAQTVAGVRQYTQLVALMDNWDNGDNDSFQANLDTANTAEGQLDKQSKIYEESWEAANKRVRASLEAVFTDIIDDDFFIDLTNGFASLLNSIHALMDGMGGIKPILMGIGGFLLSSISHKITPALQELGHSFSVVFQGAEKRARDLGQNMNKAIVNATSNRSDINWNDSNQQALANAMQMNEAKAKLNIISKTLTEEEKQRYNVELQILQSKQQEAQNLADKITAQKEALSLLAEEVDYESALRDLESQRAVEERALLEQRSAARDRMAANPSDTSAVTDYETASAQLAEHRQKTDELTAAREAYTKALYDTYAARMQEQSQNPSAKLAEEISFWELMPSHMNNYRTALIQITKESDSGVQRKQFVEIQKEIETITKNSLPGLSVQMNKTFKAIGTKDFNKSMADLIKYLSKAKIPAKDLEKILGKLGQGKNVNTLKKNYKTLGNDLERLKQKQQELNQSTNQFNPTHIVTGIERISKTAAGLGQLSMAVSSVRSMFAAWNNDDLSIGEKITTTLMSVSMIVPSIIGMFNNFKTALISTQAIQIAQTGSTYLQAAAISGLTTTVNAEQVAEATGLSIKEAAVVAEQANIIAKTNALAASGALAAGMTAENLAQATGMTQTQAETVLKGINAGMTTGQALAEAGLTTSRAAGLGALIANTAATVANTAAKVMNLAFSGPWGWAILAAGAAIGIATLALTSNTHATEDATAKQQANAETTQNLSDSYNKATQAAKEFKEAVSNYEEGINGLQNLQKGTEEYTEKLKEANAQAEELINKYGLWDDYVIDSETGAYIIDKEKLDAIQEQKDTAALEAKKNVSAGNIMTQQAKLQVAQGKIQDESYTRAFWNNTGKILLSSAAPINTMPYASNLDAQELDIITAKMAESGEIFSKNMSDEQFLKTIQGIEGLGDIAAKNADSLKAFKDELINASEIQKQYNNTLKNEAENIIATDIKQNQSDDIKEAFSGDFKEGTIDAVSKIIAADSNERTNYDEKLASALDSANLQDIHYDDANKLDMAQDKYGGNMSLEDVTKEYAKLRGYSEEELANVTFTDKDYKGTLKTESGETILDGVEFEDMIRALKTAEIQSQISEETSSEDAADREIQAQALGEMVQAFNGEIEGMGDAILTSMTQGKDTEGNYNLDLSSTFSELDTQEQVDEYKNLDATQLLEKLGLSEQDIINAGFESAKDFEEAFDEGLGEWTLDKHEDALQAKVDGILSEGASKYGLDEEVLKKQAKLIQQNTKGMENNAEAAAQMAIANQRMNKGVKTLSDNWAGWNKTLRSGDKTTQDYAEALVGAETAMRDILAIGDDAVIPEDFLQAPENLDLLDQIAQGSEEAVDKLHFNLTKAQIEAEEFSAEIGQNMADRMGWSLAAGEEPLKAAFERMKTEAMSALTEIQSMADGLDIGAGLSDPAKQAQLAADLNEFAAAAGWTAEQMQSALASVGVTAKIDMVEMGTITKQIPKIEITRSKESEDSEGNVTWTETSKTVDYISHEEPNLVPQISMEDPKNPKGQQQPIFSKIDKGTIAPSVTSTGGDTGGGGGGGGKSKKPTKPTQVKPTEKKQKNDEVERYHEINEALDDLQNNLDEISNLKDEVWGRDKLAAMDQERAKLVEITKAQKKYQDEIAKNLNDDKWAAGQVGAQFDENGRITNFEELQEQWLNEWNAQAAAFDAQEQNIENRLAAAKDAEDEDLQEQLQGEKDALSESREKADKEYEEKRKALQQYEETLNLSEEAKAQLDDYFRQIRQLNYEQLQYKIELSVEINESDLADVEHKLNRLSETDIYSSAERIATISQNAELQKNLAKTYIDGIAEATQKYNAYLNGDLENGIDQASYIEMLQENKANLQDVEMSIREGIEQIGDELESAFDLADERLDKQYAKFDQLIELMDHYKNIVSLTKGEAAYKELNDVLRASQTVIKNRIAADEAEVALWKNKRAELEAEIASGALTGEALEQANESLDVIIEKEAEANSQLRADIEQLGEYAREIFENSIEQAAKSFETEMFGGSLSGVIESIEMMNARQEELLTTTNKIYETNKLIRNVEKDIEATTNNRAKQAYAEFQNKVRQKQEQNELTKFELDLLTAEYEMTKAQIALEEAQEAKDTVRLTRDSEGNYGYVYTANQDKVSDAEQQLEDATNSYYNTAMDGAQKYQDQIYQHIQEWEEKTKEVYLDQTLSEEEKQKKLKEIQDTYNTLITQDKQLFYIAKAAMEETSYTHQADYDLKGIESAENWFTSCDTFLNDMETAQNEYDKNTEEVAGHTERNFGNMTTAIGNAKTESKNFRDEITGPGGLASELETTLTNAIGTAKGAWEEYLGVLKDVVTWTDKAMKQNSQENDIAMANDYSQLIIDEIKVNGENADEEYIERLLNERDKKLNGIDLQDYSALIANAEDEATAEAWKRMRDRKIQTMQKTDYTQMLYDYLATDGASLDDQKAQDILTMRQHKIWGLGVTDAISNEELIQQILNNQNSQKQSSTDTTQEATPEQDNSDPGSGIKNGASMKFISFTGKAYANTNGGFVDNGYWSQNQSDLGNVQNQKFNESDKTWYLQSSKYPDKWFKQEDIQAFLTGGYTGAWGPEGRLAMLHEKELVLNKRDTENFLTATNILREISNMLDTNALIASLGAFNLKAMTLNSPADQVLQQEVTIHADFPNVTDHNEIELAIDNLINAASQHAYRT